MTTLEESTQAILDLHALTRGFGTGSPPDPSSVLGYQSNLVRLHMLLGQELSRKFGGKEGRYLDRKIAEAKMYRHGRIELKKTGVDSTNDALLAVGEEFQAEIDTAEEYESYRSMLQALDRAFSHSMQVVSFLGKAESFPQRH